MRIDWVQLFSFQNSLQNWIQDTAERNRAGPNISCKLLFQQTSVLHCFWKLFGSAGHHSHKLGHDRRTDISGVGYFESSCMDHLRSDYVFGSRRCQLDCCSSTAQVACNFHEVVAVQSSPASRFRKCSVSISRGDFDHDMDLCDLHSAILRYLRNWEGSDSR